MTFIHFIYDTSLSSFLLLAFSFSFGWGYLKSFPVSFDSSIRFRSFFFQFGLSNLEISDKEWNNGGVEGTEIVAGVH